MIEIFLFLIGAISGSFAMASVWRLRADQLKQEKKPTVEYKKLINKAGLTKQKTSQDYSRCLHCGHRLKWQDLIPVISWLSIGGKCRYCKKPIGCFEFLLEIGMGGLFIFSYLLLYQYMNFFSFAIFLGLLVVLAILFVYDYKWMLMPSNVLYLFVFWSVLFAIGQNWGIVIDQSLIINYLVSIVILSGIYGLLWLISKGSWVGDGDIWLGFGLALILGNWLLAFVCLFLSNFIGTLIVLPKLLKKDRKNISKIALGPLLILGSLLTLFIQQFIFEYFYFIN